MQRVLAVTSLPDSAIEASAAFFADYLLEARSILREGESDALAIILPPAPRDHDDWRRALARDLARESAPKRVNVIGGAGEGLDETLAYLGNAPGVTGQYCPLHE
ncbi:Rossmann fold domain-containing protein [Erythrobacter sp. GH1-10]|uniref:Rossmann fold domain-containing protein n=1 Tax=Erythrobacter sp. GH1-10 TaxID=3349334 RepID=UPI003878012C